MLFVSINSPKDLQSIPAQVDGVELRLDLCHLTDLPFLANLIKNSSHPLMLTLRSVSHGGKFQGSEKEKESYIEEILKLEPAFCDLEYDMRQDFIEKMLQNFPKTKFVLSYHNFEEVPSHLETIYQCMAKHPAYTYKIAVMPYSTNEALRALLFARKQKRISLICMGDKGSFARILGPINKNIIDFASISKESETAPGQISLHDFMEIYRYPILNAETALYGLIGDPVVHSQGHIHHNGVFKKRQLNALYIKMALKEDELSDFFLLAKEIGFSGLSVTMPLKEKVLPLLDTIDPKAEQIGAVNTLLFKNGKIFGTNTDGVGALDALETRGSVFGKTIVILGAGGAGKAIAFEAKYRGAFLIILNRTIDTAYELSKAIKCDFGSLSDIPNSYDILINCSSSPMPIDPNKILPKSLVMDIVYFPKKTPFLEKASELGCNIVYGDEMFFNQAAAQTNLWINS